MPELPEVETVRRGLDALIVAKTIESVAVHDSPKSFPNAQSDVDAFLIGARVTAVHRRAKVLLIELDSDYTLVVHLKMTGQLVFRGHEVFGAGHPNDSLIGELPDRSTRVSLQFTDKSWLYFNDQRKFGWMKLFPTSVVPSIDFMQRLGPEPFDPSFHATTFVQRMRRRNRTTVKAAILDQSVLAGVGNIYADESLWAAHIHPAMRVEACSDDKLATLFAEIKSIMQTAIDKGGSTNKNYVNADGKRGSYMDFARVFRREGQSCYRCQTTIEKTRVAGRGTHLCPVCQPTS